MDIFDLFGIAGLWIRSDPQKSGAVADALWSPLALLVLFLFAMLAVVYCVSSPHH